MKTFEVKTTKDGQQDVFFVLGDIIDDSSVNLRIFKSVGNGEELVACFNNWMYVMEVTENEKPPE